MPLNFFAIGAIFLLQSVLTFAIFAKSGTEIANMPETEDAELQAIAACLAALRPLTEAARHRVMNYVTERLASEAPTQNGGERA